MSLYQFLIAVRSEGSQLTNADGETTSHLMGTFYRTIRLVENGIKPVYVFDGKPPELKSGELNKRAEKREEAQKALTQAEESGMTFIYPNLTLLCITLPVESENFYAALLIMLKWM